MKGIHLAPGLTLPLDVVTEAIGVLARRRAGKSYLARRFAEQLLKAQQQVVIVDPKGDWWGIRSSADGKGPGFPVTILGGERGDVPLEASAGEVVAKLAVEERANILLDLSLLRKHEYATFMAHFLEGVYRLKAREDFRTAMMLIIDEADAVAPQSTKQFGAKGGDVERMLGAANDIVRRGGQRGIGCTLITQRSAVLNKDVLTQCQILIALRTIAPQDLEAIKAWIDVHGTPERRKVLMESLPSLPRGDAWVWSPGWPTEEGIFHRGHTLPIETFDSGATPGPGEKRKEPKAPAAVDLDALKRQMAATIERAKADDPRELRRKIADLEKRLRARVPAAQAAPPPAKVREVPVLKDAQVKRIEAAIRIEERIAERCLEMNAKTLAALKQLADAVRAFTGAATSARVTACPPLAPVPGRFAAPPGLLTFRGPTVRAVVVDEASGDLTGTQRNILDVAGDLVRRGIEPRRESIARWLGIHPNGGRFLSDLARLRAGGYLDGCRPTEAAGQLIRGREMGLEGAMRGLDGTQQKILQVLIASDSPSMTREQLASALGIHPNGGRFLSDLAWLRTMGVITERSPIATTPALFA